MHFICLRDKLARALTFTQRVVSRNFTLPILESLLIETEKGQLKITATNLEIALRCWVPGKVEKEGALTVPAGFLGGIIHNLRTEKIESAVKGTTLHISTQGYAATIKGQNAEDFPVVPPVKGETTIIVGAPELLEALAQLQNIITVSEARPEISGVLMQFEKEAGLFAATDSFRLGEKRLGLKEKIKTKTDGLIKIIVPLRAVQELIRVLESAEGSVTIQIDANQALFLLPHLQLTTRLIDGSYPDYEKIIPQEFATETTFDRGELIERIRLVSIFSGKTNDVRLHLDEAKQALALSASSSEAGEGETKLAATIKGESVDVVFNYRYLLDGLENINGDKVLFKINTNTKPSLLRGVKDTTYRYVVMPIRE